MQNIKNTEHTHIKKIDIGHTGIFSNHCVYKHIFYNVYTVLHRLTQDEALELNLLEELRSQS